MEDSFIFDIIIIIILIISLLFILHIFVACDCCFYSTIAFVKSFEMHTCGFTHGQHQSYSSD